MNFVRVGYISGTFGLDGAVRVKPITENPEIFYNMEFLLLSKIYSLVPVKSLKIDDIREHKNYFVVELSSINKIKEAENLKGFSVVIPEYMLPEENEDEIYWYKINGACVNNLQNDKIGILCDYMETGSKDVFRIKLNNGGYALVSNNKDHVLNIDTKNKIVTVNEEGLVFENL